MDKKKIIHDLLLSLKDQVDYADIRWHQKDLDENITTFKGDIYNYSYNEREGLGIRVLFQGAWGFASTESFAEIEKTAAMAIKQAEASSKLRNFPIELHPKESVKASYSSPMTTNPFEVDVDTKIKRIKQLDELLADESFANWGVSASFFYRDIYFADSEGSVINRHLLEIDCGLTANATDCDGLMQRRSYQMSLNAEGSIGYENIDDKNWETQIARIKEELKAVVNAPQCEDEKCDLIILPEMMALQTHETIGHALELDRILGYELSYAGGSHVTLDDFDQKVFGSPLLNARANGCVPNSPGSTGFDDDGYPAQNISLIEAGKLKNAITSRQMVMEANQQADKTVFESPGAANRAQSYDCMPIERMNNINVAPGNGGSLEEIIANTKNGLVVETPRSWSIGSNRENFHFACEIGWKVKDGKISHIVRNPTYAGDSLPFWRSLDCVGSKETWELQQVFMCGKGQPNQIMRLGHGVPICRFTNVKVGNQ
jgi:TldD protein